MEETYTADELIEDLACMRIVVDLLHPFKQVPHSWIDASLKEHGIMRKDIARVRGVSESSLSTWLNKPVESWGAGKCAEFINAISVARMEAGVHHFMFDGRRFDDCGKLAVHRRLLLQSMPIDPNTERPRQNRAEIAEEWSDLLRISADLELTYSDKSEVARHLLALMATNAAYGEFVNRAAHDCMRIADDYEYGLATTALFRSSLQTLASAIGEPTR